MFATEVEEDVVNFTLLDSDKRGELAFSLLLRIHSKIWLRG
jgi:hypothetical protein